MLKRSCLPQTHEDVVSHHYASLRKLALHLTHGQEADAEDLLHDAFVRFILLRPVLDDIDNLDGYLHAILRNVHLSSRRRRVALEVVSLDTIEHELLTAMVGEVEVDDRLCLREDLDFIVDRVCRRKSVSRGAGALILRCFHGYYPSEIAHLLKISPRAVDFSVHAERRETLEQLRRRTPGRVRSLRVVRGRRGIPVSDPVEYFNALRARIFASIEGSCLAPGAVAALYEADAGSGVSSDVVAHLVSCPACLDRANHHLGLAPLAERHPMETCGRRRPRGGPPAGGDCGAGPGTVMRRARATVASVVDHVPNELRVTANGVDLGSQQIGSAVSVQELPIRLAESLAFIEIFDERGAVLCYWPAQLPVDGQVEQRTRIELSSGRWFDLEVLLAEDCPRLLMCYTDSRLEQGFAGGRHGTHAWPPVTTGRFLTALPPNDTRGPLRDRQRGRPASGRLDAVDSRPGAVGAKRLSRATEWLLRLLSWRPQRFAHAGIALLLLVLWLTLVGPSTTWAAVTRLGRATVTVLRTLFVSDTSQPPTSSSRSLPASRIAPELLVFIETPSALGRRLVWSRPRGISRSALADLEMRTRVTLHQLRADLGEDVALAVTPAGVTIRGVVESEARREEIARALARQPSTRVQLRTAQEVAAAHKMATASAPMDAVDLRGQNPATLDAPLRLSGTTESPALLDRLLTDRLPDPSARDTFVSSAFQHAEQALARAWALRRLATRYARDEVSGLTPRSREALAGLTRNHIGELRQVVHSMSALVNPLLAEAAGSDLLQRQRTEAGDRPTDLWRLTELLVAQTQRAHMQAGILLADGGNGGTDAATTARALLVTLNQLQNALVDPPDL